MGMRKQAWNLEILIPWLLLLVAAPLALSEEPLFHFVVSNATLWYEVIVD